MSVRNAFVLLLLVPAALQAAAPPERIDAARVKALLRRLDDEDFFVRQKADEDLRVFGRAVQSLLVAERERSRSLEVRWRLGRILHDLTLDRRAGLAPSRQ
jgi:hypothetical protein